MKTEALLACLLALGVTQIGAAADALRDQFITPPPAARPWVFWFTLNGNLTKEGITAEPDDRRQADRRREYSVLHLQHA